MNNQRVEPWPPLGRENPRHRPVGPRIAPQPINRLGRKGDKLSCRQQSGSPRQSRPIGRQKFGRCHLVTQRLSCWYLDWG